MSSEKPHPCFNLCWKLLEIEEVCVSLLCEMKFTEVSNKQSEGLSLFFHISGDRLHKISFEGVLNFRRCEVVGTRCMLSVEKMYLVGAEA